MRLVLAGHSDKNRTLPRTIVSFGTLSTMPLSRLPHSQSELAPPHAVLVTRTTVDVLLCDNIEAIVKSLLAARQGEPFAFLFPFPRNEMLLPITLRFF